MTDPREALARIRAQADAATEGPWELLGDGEYVSGPGILVAPDDGGVTSADAEFIAAARTDVPWLLEQVKLRDKALEAVLEMHELAQPITAAYGTQEGGDYCAACAEDWPCPDYTAATTALERATDARA